MTSLHYPRVPADRRSKSQVNRLSLAKLILETGFEMDPCSLCSRRGLKCVVSDHSSRCAECVKSGRSCDVKMFSSAAVQKLLRDDRQLENEEDAVLEAIAAYQSKLQRLRKQRRLLRTRAGRMIARNSAELDRAVLVSEEAVGEPGSSSATSAAADPSPEYVLFLLSQAILVVYLMTVPHA